MKTSKKIKWLLTAIAVLFLLCCGMTCFLRNGVFYDKRIFDLSVVCRAAGVLLGVLYLVLFLLFFIKHQLKTQNVFYLIAVMLTLLLLTSINSFLDVIQGCTELKTDIYKIPVGGWQVRPSGKPVGIQLSVQGAAPLDLPVSEDIYNDLIQNNPIDRTRTVYDPLYDETVNPHLHPVMIRYYARTGVVESVQIIYDQ